MANHKVHIYIRVSDIDTQTTEQQEEACTRSYPPGIEFEIFTDKLSGWKGQRPEYETLRRLIMRGSVKELCVYSVSRLGRNQQEACSLLMECQKRNIKVKVITEGLDFSGPMGYALFALFSALAQMDSDTKSQRIREKFRHQKEQGTFVGHGRMPHTISEKIKEKAEEVYRMMDDGKGYRHINRMLNISEHTIGKLAKLRGDILVTAKMFAKLFPNWHRMGKDAYPTYEEVQKRAKKMFA